MGGGTVLRFFLEKRTKKWRFSGQKRKFWDSFAFFLFLLGDWS